MFSEAIKQMKTASLVLLFFTLLTGLVYPVIVTGIAQLLFPLQANGGLIKQNNKIVGSQLIGQSFTSSHYFWGRPSATLPFPYNAANSSGSNFGPTNPNFLSIVKKRVAALQKSDPQKQKIIPVDLVTASGSGLDPEISPFAALYQMPRIAKERGIPQQKIQLLIQKLTKNRYWGILGEPRINVLQLNLALDNL
jgi:K+-transporting ATPase ATPase C chain